MKATISLEKQGNEHLLEIFEPEDKALSNGRGSYTIKTTDSEIVFTITATDAVALRALTSSVTKVLSIHHKMSALK